MRTKNQARSNQRHCNLITEPGNRCIHVLLLCRIGHINPGCLVICTNHTDILF